jgi:hypothetical protein
MSASLFGHHGNYCKSENDELLKLPEETCEFQFCAKYDLTMILLQMTQFNCRQHSVTTDDSLTVHDTGNDTFDCRRHSFTADDM